MFFDYIDVDKNKNPCGTRVYLSKKTGKRIVFDIVGVDANGVKYYFSASGTSTGIFFSHRGEFPLMGKTLKKIRIKANLNHENIVIKWFSTVQK